MASDAGSSPSKDALAINTMQRQKLPIDKIIIQDRQRRIDPDHVDSLSLSMKELGLVQPIVINQDLRLIAGGHRIAAARKLGWSEIDIVFRETLTEDELQELELTENVKRKDISWQDHVCAIAKIHELKRRRAALDSKTWFQTETGALFRISQTYVSHAVVLARAIQANDEEIINSGGPDSAWSVIMRREEELAMQELSSRNSKVTMDTLHFEIESFLPKSVDQVKHIDSDSEVATIYDGHLRQILEEKGQKGYFIEVNEYPHLVNRVKEHFLAFGRKEEEFESFWKEKLDWANTSIQIDLSSHFIKGNSIAFMSEILNKERFDHIITDIPYGIDIEMADQHVGIADIETIKAEHTIEGNKQLFKDFFPSAFKCLKPNAFLITWCDQMLWQEMYDIAIDSGFKVQRWPFIWCKDSICLNQMAQFNFTKSTEIVMVCRKGVITLSEKQGNNYIVAPRDELCEKINHPFAKPFACWKRLMEAVSIQNQSILDPFAGRGSSLISGLKIGRNMYGIEINENHYNAGLENLKNFYLELNPKTLFS